MPRITQRKHTATHQHGAPQTTLGGLWSEWRNWTPSKQVSGWLVFAAGIAAAVAVYCFPWLLVFVLFWQAPVRGIGFVVAAVLSLVLFSKAEQGEE